jgi:hypothetical protein
MLADCMMAGVSDFSSNRRHGQGTSPLQEVRRTKHQQPRFPTYCTILFFLTTEGVLDHTTCWREKACVGSDSSRNTLTRCGLVAARLKETLTSAPPYRFTPDVDFRPCTPVPRMRVTMESSFIIEHSSVWRSPCMSLSAWRDSMLVLIGLVRVVCTSYVSSVEVGKLRLARYRGYRYTLTSQ